MFLWEALRFFLTGDLLETFVGMTLRAKADMIGDLCLIAMLLWLSIYFRGYRGMQIFVIVAFLLGMVECVVDFYASHLLQSGVKVTSLLPRLMALVVIFVYPVVVFFWWKMEREVKASQE